MIGEDGAGWSGLSNAVWLLRALHDDLPGTLVMKSGDLVEPGGLSDDTLPGVVQHGVIANNPIWELARIDLDL
jgi:hypothetical protein